jgi:hypothetical protein
MESMSNPQNEPPVDPAAANPGKPPEARSVAGGPAYTDAELRHAFQAFKKRLKLSKLDQESHLGAGRPMTAGKKSDIQQMMPPNQFPREIWKELAARKQIKDHGGGFYSIP